MDTKKKGKLTKKAKPSADPERPAAAEPQLPEPDAQGLRKPRGAEPRNIGTIAQQLDLNQRNTLLI